MAAVRIEVDREDLSFKCWTYYVARVVSAETGSDIQDPEHWHSDSTRKGAIAQALDWCEEHNHTVINAEAITNDQTS